MRTAYSASTKLKGLHRARRDYSSADGIEVSLKDFAVDLATNGTKEEKELVKTWFKNKAGGKE